MNTRQTAGPQARVPKGDKSIKMRTRKVGKRTHNEIDTKEWMDTKPSLKGGCLYTFWSPYYEIVLGDNELVRNGYTGRRCTGWTGKCMEKLVKINEKS
jgi:hypothetical protein